MTHLAIRQFGPFVVQSHASGKISVVPAYPDEPETPREELKDMGTVRYPPGVLSRLSLASEIEMVLNREWSRLQAARKRRKGRKG